MNMRLVFPLFVAFAALFIPYITFADSSGNKVPYPQELGIANNPNKVAFPQTITDEPTIAVNPTNANNIVITANDFTNPSGLNLNGIYTSFDKGHSWSQQILNWSSTGYQAQADNSVAFGPLRSSERYSYKNGARAYICADTFLNDFSTSAEAVSFAYSDDGGKNWNGLKIIGPADATVENDRPVITTDPWPQSPNFGNVYATWDHQQFTDASQSNFASESIMVVTSKDGGVTFSNPVPISSSDVSNNKSRWGAFPVTAPDGSLYVFWWEVLDPAGTNVIEGNKSTDGGKTWLPQPFRVATNIFPPAFNFPFAPLPGTVLFNRPIPSAAVDVHNNVYVVYPSYNVNSDHGWISMAQSTDGGNTWHQQTVADVKGRSPIYPSVSVNRFHDSSSMANVMVSFMAFDDVPAGTLPGAGVTLGDAYSVLSTNSGGTFSPPVKISTMSSDPDAASSEYVYLEFMGDYTWVTDSPDGSFYYAWTDSRRGQTCPAVDAFRQGTGPYPDVSSSCPANFGRTDIFVAKINSAPAPRIGE